MIQHELLADKRVRVLFAGLFSAWLLGGAFNVISVFWMLRFDSFDPLLWTFVLLDSMVPPLPLIMSNAELSWRIVPFGTSTGLVCGVIAWRHRPQRLRGDARW